MSEKDAYRVRVAHAVEPHRFDCQALSLGGGVPSVGD